MISRLLRHCASCLLIAGIVGPGSAAEPKKDPAAAAPSLEGTYRLVSRKLADGKVLGRQDIVALVSYTKTHRNFNLVWKNASGKHWSFSLVSTYALTATQYTETPLAIFITDEMGGTAPSYSMNLPPQTVPIKVNGGRIEFKMPFDPVTAVFDGNKFIGTNAGAWVDTWEKIK